MVAELGSYGTNLLGQQQRIGRIDIAATPNYNFTRFYISQLVLRYLLTFSIGPGRPRPALS